MITSVFRKSTPLNYSILIILILFSFFTYQLQDSSWTANIYSVLEKLTILVVLLSSVFISNFIVKKNGLTKDSSNVILFFTLLLMFVPKIFNNLNLVFANFFVLLALRRLISLKTLKEQKEKIFDASLWIFVASLFHFWCILFILLVFISIILSASRDYRNWILPFVAFFGTITIFIFTNLIFEKNWINHILLQTKLDYQLDYFSNNFQNLSLSLLVMFSLFFVGAMIFSLSKKPQIVQASYKKMIFAFFIAVAVYLISPDKSNALLIFTFFPLTVMASNNIEYSKNKLHTESVLFLTIIAAFVIFLFQL